MTDLEEFQQAHGQQWALILQNPAFSAGMLHLNIQLIEYIKNLSNEQIRNDAPVILADIRGKLLHEHALFSLPIIEPPVVTGEVATEYPNSVDENFDEIERRKPKTDL